MQTIVITGIAQGMGREVAKLLAGPETALAGFDIDEQALSTLKDELANAACDHLLVPLDIRNRPGLVEFRDAVLGRFGHVDVVVSNVGIGFFGPFEEVDLDEALACLEINVIGSAALFQAFLPSMRERRCGTFHIRRIRCVWRMPLCVLGGFHLCHMGMASLLFYTTSATSNVRDLRRPDWL